MNPGEPYTITIEVKVPDQAISPQAGLYVGDKRIAPLQAGNLLTASLAPSTGDMVRLELRAGGWVPQRAIPGSSDPRTLGVRVSKVTMRNAAAGTNVFNANTGAWLAPATPPP